METSRTFTINLVGDVMLGRLIDQLFPTHVDCPEEARIISSMRAQHSNLSNYGPESPWGNALPLMRSGDLNIINLETSVTTHATKWPNKVFNYRMHPDNIEALKVAHVDHVSLANNHTLDFSEAGLVETVRTIKQAGISLAGAGETTVEAREAAQLLIPKTNPASRDPKQAQRQHTIHLSSFSDHPRDWASVPCFNYIDYTQATRRKLKEQLNLRSKPSLKILSVHWGPNYCHAPSAEIRSLAHFFIDECGVDLIHGHSSHHIQGVETYKGKIIIYGCGDFVDDYAVDREWRNDLSALWRVTVAEQDEKLKVKKLEVYPNRIKTFQAELLDPSDDDHKLLKKRFRKVCSEMGTRVEEELGENGQILIKVP